MVFKLCTAEAGGVPWTPLLDWRSGVREHGTMLPLPSPSFFSSLFSRIVGGEVAQLAFV